MLLDIDGTIARFADKFDALVQANSNFKSDFSRYDLGIPEKEFRVLYDLMIDAEIMLDLVEYDSAAYTVQRWAKHHDIWYVTRRRSGNYSEMREHHIQVQTKIWLLRNGFPKPHQVVFTQDKADWCRANGIEVGVEDYGPDCVKIGKDIPCYLINRPWNASTAWPLRVNYLQEVDELG